MSARHHGGIRHRRRGDVGQSTVEVALVLPVVVVLALLLVQIGVVVHQRIMVTHAAREAARAAAVTPDGLDGVEPVASRHGLDPDRLDATLGGPDAEGYVTVELTYRAATDVVLVGALVPDVTLDAGAAMLAEW